MRFKRFSIKSTFKYYCTFPGALSLIVVKSPGMKPAIQITINLAYESAVGGLDTAATNIIINQTLSV